MMQRKHTHLIISFAVFLVVSFLFFAGYLSNIQSTILDNAYGGLQPLEEIVIVAIDDSSLQEIGRWPWNRSVFADVIQKLNNTRVIAIDVGFFEESPDDDELGMAISESGRVILAAEYTSFERGDGIIGKDVLLPVEPIRAGAELGYINVITDRDGITRSLNTNIKGDVVSFPHKIVEETFSKQVESYDRFMINFVGPPGSFKTYSFADVISKRIDLDIFENKIVIIGATSPDLHDAYFVPTSKGRAMPGAEILANSVQTMILENQLQNQSTFSLLLVLFVLCLLIALAFVFLRVRTVTILALIVLCVYVFIVIFAFNTEVLLNIVYPPLTIFLVYTSNLVYTNRFRKQQRDEIKKAFGKYVSPDVINEIMKSPEKLSLGGERRNITVFFSDIRGFTSISEVLTPEQLVNLLNEYLTEMTDIVIEERGILDKYMGDAIMAFWGAPILQKDHPARAARVSLKMMRRLKEMQVKWREEGIPALDIGIGLNTGDAVVGNMGSTQRFDYTAMGDVVNTGSRLEGVNKQYGTNILISEFTYERIKHEFYCRKLDMIKVKGRDTPLIIYELVSEIGGLSSKQKKAFEHFNSGMKKYWDRKWTDAISEFKKALEILPHDGPSAKMIDRCTIFKKDPPDNHWDGVYVMKTK